MAHLRIWIFAASTLSGVGAVLGLQSLPWFADPFTVTASAAISPLHMPLSETVSAKFRHAIAVGHPVDVGVFGDSSVRNVRISELGPLEGFNFAVGGTSFRQTVQSVTQLRAHELQPRISLIQIDHFENGLPDNPVWPGRPGYWFRALGDVFGSATDRAIPWRETMWTGLRYGKEETRWIAGRFNFHHLRQRVSARFPRLGPGYAEPGANYSRDGSFPGKANEKETFAVPVFDNRMLPNTFLRDLSRLAELADADHRIIVYESPLARTAALHFSAQPTDAAQSLRAGFASICAATALQCHLAPVPGTPGRISGWHDVSHPPRPWLESYLRALLGGAGL
jgi:hypothetical protein